MVNPGLRGRAAACSSVFLLVLAGCAAEPPENASSDTGASVKTPVFRAELRHTSGHTEDPPVEIAPNCEHHCPIHIESHQTIIRQDSPNSAIDGTDDGTEQSNDLLGQVMVTGEANVRREPLIDPDNVIAFGHFGDTATIVEKSSERDNEDLFWYLVRLQDGDEGWIREDFLE